MVWFLIFCGKDFVEYGVEDFILKGLRVDNLLKWIIVFLYIRLFLDFLLYFVIFYDVEKCLFFFDCKRVLLNRVGFWGLLFI